MNEQITRAAENKYIFEIPGTLADYKLIINGRLPGLNEYTDLTRANRYMGAKLKGETQGAIGWSIRAQLGKKKIEKPVFLIFTWYEKDKRRDHDNVSSFGRKVIQDALVECGTLADDGWDNVTGFIDIFKTDTAHPRVEVQFIEQEGVIKCRKKRKKSLPKSKQ